MANLESPSNKELSIKFNAPIDSFEKRFCPCPDCIELAHPDYATPFDPKEFRSTEQILKAVVRSIRTRMVGDCNPEAMDLYLESDEFKKALKEAQFTFSKQ